MTTFGRVWWCELDIRKIRTLRISTFRSFIPRSSSGWRHIAVPGQATRAPSQYPKSRLFVRSRKVSKPRDWYFKLSYRFEIWQAHRQHCCRSACQISERSDNSKYKSRGFGTLRDLTKRRLFGYWDGAQAAGSRLYKMHFSETAGFFIHSKFLRIL